MIDAGVESPEPNGAPIYGPYRWDAPPEHWYQYAYADGTIYGDGITGRSVVYVASMPAHTLDVPLVGNALGEIRVEVDGRVAARFPYYPDPVAEPPDIPDWTRANSMAKGYAWRIDEQRRANNG